MTTPLPYIGDWGALEEESWRWRLKGALLASLLNLLLSELFQLSTATLVIRKYNESSVSNILAGTCIFLAPHLTLYVSTLISPITIPVGKKNPTRLSFPKFSPSFHSSLISNYDLVLLLRWRLAQREVRTYGLWYLISNYIGACHAMPCFVNERDFSCPK